MKITNPIGKKGEDLAVEYLKKKGYKIVERNYHGRQGEIDIIAICSETNPSTHKVYPEVTERVRSGNKVLVFVEVKTRTSSQFGTPLESIRSSKLSAIEITAQLYKSQHPKLPDAMRIDAVAVELDQNKKPAKIEHIENIGEF